MSKFNWQRSPKKLKFGWFFLIILSLFSFVSIFGVKDLRAQNECTLSLQPASLKKKIGETFSLEVKISAPEKILGADIDIAYDPTILSVEKVVPSGFFTNPQILTSQISQKEGLILLSIFSYPTTKGNGTVATITFKALKEASPALVQFEATSVISTVGDKKIAFKTFPGAITILREGASPISIPQGSTSKPTLSQSVLTPSPAAESPSSTKTGKPFDLTRIISFLLVVVAILIFIITLAVL